MEDEVKGLRPFPLGLDRWGCSLGREEEGESSSGSSSRDWELLGNGDSSDVVEGVLCKLRMEVRKMYSCYLHLDVNMHERCIF